MVKFKKVKFKNILATGNTFIEIDLDKYPSTLIIGKNGAGKSTLLDVLCFVLFNTPFRNINKPTLLNSINQKDGLGEVEFVIGTKEYKVVRGLKPNIFEIYIDGILLNQDAKSKDYQKHLEEHILKMNYKSFTQIVILGSSTFIPFMQLKTSDRRSIIEDLLDIKIFSAMNLVLKGRLSFIKDSVTDIKHNIEVLEQNKKFVEKTIKNIESNTQEQIGKYNKDIYISEEKVNNLTEQVELISTHTKQLQNKITDELKIINKKNKLNQFNIKIGSKLKAEEKIRNFYINNDNCPTCTQEINPILKINKQDESNTNIQKYESAIDDISIEIKSVEDRFKEIQTINKSISEHTSEIIKYNTSINETNKAIVKLKKEVSEYKNKSGSLDNEKNNLLLVNKNIHYKKKELEVYITDKHYYDIAAMLLKDSGIKTKVVEQYLPVMNKTINKYLAAMDFFVNFELDENFNETIKSRHRDEFTYNNFSQGQRQKIDLSLLFTWRTVAKMKNSASTNLLILDETFDSSLDAEGTEALMKILETMTETNIFVISHKKDLLIDKFKNVLEFEIVHDFSRMKEH